MGNVAATAGNLELNWRLALTVLVGVGVNIGFTIFFWSRSRVRHKQMGINWLFLRSLRILFRCSRCCCDKVRCRGKLPPWQDPSVTRTNTLRPHTPLKVHDTIEEALEDDPFSSSRTVLERRVRESKWNMSLDTSAGTIWNFKLFESPGHLGRGAFPPSVPEFVQGSQVDSENGWSPIQVPGSWELQGHGTPIYTNQRYPWLKAPTQAGPWFGRVPRDSNPTGCYHCDFQLPEDWETDARRGRRRLFLILNGVSSCARVFVDGVEVGYMQDSFTEAEFDVTDAINDNSGSHSLALQVMRFSDGSYLEDQDHWWLSGIQRSVKLQSRPAPVSITDYRVETYITNAASLVSNAVVVVSVQLDVQKSAWKSVTRTGQVRCVLYDGSRACSDVCKEIGAHERVVVEVPVASPARWSPDTPELYTLGVQLLVDRKPVQAEVHRVGFRDVRLERDPAEPDSQQLYLTLNRRRCVIKGVNYHEHDERGGKHVSPTQFLDDLILMKRSNFNAVRCCHYPHDHRFYELCDELGLLVCDEANIESHGFALSGILSMPSCDPDWEHAFTERVKSMALRAKNYSCIFMWSLGNESGYGPNHVACACWLREFDSRRPLQYEGGRDHGDAVLLLGNGRGDRSVTDIICPMYDSPYQIGVTSRDPMEERPIILCEYGHAMGNSGGNAHQYWDAFWDDEPSRKSMQGGFIWDWVDQIISTPDGRRGYGGDFGPSSGKEDSTFCVNGLIFIDRSPHPSLHEFAHLQRPITFELACDQASGVRVTNRFMARGLDNISFRYEVRRTLQHEDGSIEEAFESAGVIPFDPDTMSRIKPRDHEYAPGGCFVIDLQYPGGWSSLANSSMPVFLDMRACIREAEDWAPAGHVVAYQRLQLSNSCRRSGLAVAEPSSSASQADALSVVCAVDSNGNRSVETPCYRVAFDPHGQLTSLVKPSTNGADLHVCNPNTDQPIMRHCFYRAPTDNDKGGADAQGIKLSDSTVNIIDSVFGDMVSDVMQASIYSKWKAAGLGSLRRECCSSEFHEHGLPRERAGTGGGAACLCNDLIFRGAMDLSLFRVQETWEFHDSHCSLNVTVRALPALGTFGLISLPRIGVAFQLNSSFEHATWLGRGPHECYPDRKASAYLGVHSMSVRQMHTPYEMPSENGGRADCTQITLSTAAGSAVQFIYSTPDDPPQEEISMTGKRCPTSEAGELGARPADMSGAQVSVSQFSVAELEQATHDTDLQAGSSGSVHLHIDTSHMGVGGDSSWEPRTHRQYCIAPRPGTTWNYSVDVRLS